MGAAFQHENFVYHLISIEILKKMFQQSFSAHQNTPEFTVYPVLARRELAGWINYLYMYNCFQNYLDGPCTLPLKARDGEGVGNI